MKSNLLLSLLLLAALPGCSKFSRLPSQAGFTEVTVNKRSASFSTLATLSGGLMVYALRDDGFKTTIRLNDELDERSVLLPNGNYTFRAVGYPAANLTGTPKCGVSGTGVLGISYALKGISTVIPITVSNDGCLTDAFADSNNRTTTLRKPKLVFCGDNTSFATQTSSTDCTVGNESAKFFLGKTAINGVKYGLYNPLADRLVYMADSHRGNVFELFSVKPDGGKSFRVNGKLGTGEVVSQALTIPNTRKILYLAGSILPTAPTTKLFIVDPELGSPREFLPSAFNYYVRQIKITYDGSHVVFVGSDKVTHKDYLFAASLANLDAQPTPFLLSPGSIASGSALGVKATDPLYRLSFAYKLFPDDVNAAPGQISKVLLVGSFATAKDELYTASVNNASIGLQKLSPGTGILTKGIAQSAFNYNGTKVLWTADDTTNNRLELYGAYFGQAVSYRISDTGISGGCGSFISGSDEDVVYFSQDKASANQFDLTKRSFTTLESLPASITLFAGPAGNSFWVAPSISTDGTQITFLMSDTSGSPMHKLYAYDKTNNHIFMVNHSGLASNLDPMIDNVNRMYMIAKRDQIYYAGNNAGVSKAVFKTDVTTSQNGTVLDFPATTTFGYNSFFAINDWVFYSMGNTTGTEVYQAYAKNVVPGGASVTYSLPITMASVSSFNTSVSTAKYPRPLFMNGLADAAVNIQDAYFKEDYALAFSDTHKLSHAHEVAAEGVGKFRLALLAYTKNTDGTITVDEANSIYGNWELASHTVDGGTNTPGSFLPVGKGSDNPFALSIEISQDGTLANSERRILSSGLIGATNPANKAFAVSDSSDLRVFVAD